MEEKNKKTSEMPRERAIVLLNALIDWMIEGAGLRPREAIGALLEMGFTQEELIDLKFDEADVLELSAEPEGNEDEE